MPRNIITILFLSPRYVAFSTKLSFFFFLWSFLCWQKKPGILNISHRVKFCRTLDKKAVLHNLLPLPLSSPNFFYFQWLKITLRKFSTPVSTTAFRAVSPKEMMSHRTQGWDYFSSKPPVAGFQHRASGHRMPTTLDIILFGGCCPTTIKGSKKPAMNFIHKSRNFG
jgi:hypothetical protein